MDISDIMGLVNEKIQNGLQVGVEGVKRVISSIQSTPALPNTRLDGQVCIVTGANTGIGKEAARELLKRGAKVILACRDESKGKEAEQELIREGGQAVFTKLDLASLKSVEEFCTKIIREEASIDILINNAGVFTMEKTITEDGYELQFQVNYLSHFFITNLLMDKLKANDGARIINVSSKAHWFSIGIPKDVNWDIVRYNGFLAYANTKLGQILFSHELVLRLQGTGVSVYSLHPGGVNTDIGRNLTGYLPEQMNNIIAGAFNWVAKTPEDGALTTLFCSLVPNLPSGYYEDMKRGWMSPLGGNMETSKTLWELSEEFLGYKSKI